VGAWAMKNTAASTRHWASGEVVMMRWHLTTSTASAVTATYRYIWIAWCRLSGHHAKRVGRGREDTHDLLPRPTAFRVKSVRHCATARSAWAASTTLLQGASHASLVSRPRQVAEVIKAAARVDATSYVRGHPAEAAGCAMALTPRVGPGPHGDGDHHRYRRSRQCACSRWTTLRAHSATSVI
jgi:hypothetical protein